MRFEKRGKSKEQFIEVVLVGAQVYVSKGSRAKGAADWSVKDSDERRYGWSGDTSKAEAFFAETQQNALESGFLLVGEASPRIDAKRAKERADAARNEASLSLSRAKKATTADDKAALLKKARAALDEWDQALSAMSAEDRAGFKKTYGRDLEKMQAEVKK